MMSTTLLRSELASDIWGWRGGSGPSLLLIHGVGLRAEAWLQMLPHLTTHFAVTAVDLPGHGSSPCLPSDPQLADYTDRLVTLLDRPTIVVGHSMGALIAMDLAVRYPRVVAAIAPLNSIYRRTRDAKAAVIRRASALSITKPSDPTPTLSRWFGAAPRGTKKTFSDTCHNWLTSVDPLGYAQAYRVFAKEEAPEDQALAKITCPALFVTGAEEPNSTPEMSTSLARTVPFGRSVIIEGAKHMMPMTHTAEVSDVLSEFIATTLRHQSEV